MNPPGARPSPCGLQLPETTLASCNSCPLPRPRDMGTGTGLLAKEELAYLGDDPVILMELLDSIRGSLCYSHTTNAPVASDGISFCSPIATCRSSQEGSHPAVEIN